MLRLISALSLAVAFMASGANACTVPRPYDPNRIFKMWSRESIVRIPEVIVEGVVERHDRPSSATDTSEYLYVATMRIDRAWKGEIGAAVVLVYPRGSGDCSLPPPLGQKIRFGASIIDREVLLNSGVIHPDERSLLTGRTIILAYPRYMDFMDMPVEDRELDSLLDGYRNGTEAMKQRAGTGDRGARLAYAGYLFDNNEIHRALATYEGILRDDPSDLDLLLTLAIVRAQVRPEDEPEATLAEVERKAPGTAEWQGKIARARFAASGKLTPGWKDWSDLKRARHCEVSEGNFDDANFDRADLAACEFVRSSFRNASFLHADLNDAYFEATDLTGAKYDCATKLPDDLDPAKEGMINIEASCSAP